MVKKVKLRIFVPAESPTAAEFVPSAPCLAEGYFLSYNLNKELCSSQLMSNEIYLNHPTFGLLYRVCLLDEEMELFTTLYAQRLFFLVKLIGDKVSFEPISRSDARILVENRLRNLRRLNASQDYTKLYEIFKRTF